MLARFQTKQPNFKFAEDNKYYYCFICLNEQMADEVNEMGEPQIEYLYDYNSFKIKKEDSDLFLEVKNNPANFLDYTPEKPLTLEEEVAKLKEENQILQEQMSQITAVFNKLNI